MGKNRGGKILIENVIFIILNLAFLAILVLFIFRQGAGAVNLEESYSKQLALLIDSAKPGMTLLVNMHEVSEDEWFIKNFQKSVKITGNVVTVKLSEKGGYSYSFFNNVEPEVEVYPGGEVWITIT